MDCSRCRVLECIACASERCNAIDTLCRNHVRDKLTEGPEPAHSLSLNKHTLETTKKSARIVTVTLTRTRNTDTYIPVSRESL